MTIEDLREKLSAMNDEGYKDFLSKLLAADSAMGDSQYENFFIELGKPPSIEEFVRAYAYKPQFERTICYHLGLKTEDEKLVEGALRSAEGAAASANTAKIAVIISLASAVVSFAIQFILKKFC
ncbi:MAG: hypothetical protein Q8Q12_02815 [bacterium]|nr:hypothetical protein [bacterium]